MKRLILMRHAKSSWADSGQRDIDRPLNARGRRSAGLIDGWLAQHGYLPDRALVSTAARTRETWALMPAAAAAVTPEFRADLYDAGPETLLAALRGTADAERLMMLAHQPSIGAFAMALVAKRPEDAQFERYPTGATAIIDFDVGSWRDVGSAGGHLTAFVVPRALEPDAR